MDIVLNKEELEKLNSLSGYTFDKIINSYDLHSKEGLLEATREVCDNGDFRKAVLLNKSLAKGFRSHLEVRDKLVDLYTGKLSDSEKFIEAFEGKHVTVKDISDYLKKS